jgi:hypothetical protein
MSFTLTMAGVIVGRSELETRDPVQRTVHGVFRPGLGYELVEPVFSLNVGPETSPESYTRYVKAKAALRLQLADSSGTPIKVRELHIRRRPSASSSKGELIIEVETDDPAVWNAPAQG